MEKKDLSLLQGTFDSHVHCAPHGSSPANTDALALADLVAAAGMRGMLLKCNTFPSVGYAYLARKKYPGLAIYGGIVLNHQVGGLNLQAVESAVKYGEGTAGTYCRFVCLPTFTAYNDVAYHHRTMEPIWCTEQNGSVRDSLKRIFDCIVMNDQVLFTGHLAEAELFPVVEQAAAQGVTRILVPHPLNPIMKISLNAQKQLAAMGVYLQQCYVETYPYFQRKYGTGLSIGELAEAIRFVGIEQSIIATDMGADAGINPNPVQGFSEYMAQLAAQKFTEIEIRKMAMDNPVKLFGLM